MDLSEKIKQILVNKNITPSIFADEIGIQRSSMSHILAGRNKPSLDIVQKIVKRFPDLGLGWILDDEELPVINSNIDPSDSHRSVKPAAIPVERNEDKSKNKPIQGKQIERILVFYSDGTYKEYREA